MIFVVVVFRAAYTVSKGKIEGGTYGYSKEKNRGDSVRLTCPH